MSRSLKKATEHVNLQIIQPKAGSGKRAIYSYPSIDGRACFGSTPEEAQRNAMIADRALRQDLH